MKSLRLLLLLVAGGCFLHSVPALAQSAAPAYVFPKQFSADEVVTAKGGQMITIKNYTDNGKIRNEVSSNGMQIVSIVRLDQQKAYSVMVAQKMVMVMPLDAEKIKMMVPPGAASGDKMETVGPDAVDGTDALKYKITNAEGKVAFLWVDVAKQVPVKFASEDGTVVVVWSNFQAGPQSAALFEPPSDYQVMTMPAPPGGAPSAPPSAPPGGG